MKILNNWVVMINKILAATEIIEIEAEFHNIFLIYTRSIIEPYHVKSQIKIIKIASCQNTQGGRL